MTDSRDEHERYGYTPSVSEGELLGWLRSEADAAARIPSPWVMLIAAADTIERLRAERDDALKQIDELQDVCGDSADRMVELRAERDKARRMYCEEVEYHHETVWNDGEGDFKPLPALDVAKQNGWDCYSKEGDK